METLLPVPARPNSAPAVASLGLADLAALWLSGRKPSTVRAYARDLADLANYLGAPGPTPALDWLCSLDAPRAHVAALGYRAWLVHRGLSSATVARRLSALRSVLKLARQLGRVDWSLEIEAPSVASYRDTRGPGDDGWRAMLAAAESEAAGGSAISARNLAIVRLLHDCALRRSEVCGLDFNNVERPAAPAAVHILGKGRSARERVTLPGPTSAVLLAWIRVRGAWDGPLFVRCDRGAGWLRKWSLSQARRGDRLTGQGVADLVAKLGRAGGLERKARPHGLRHQGITRALDRSGGDVRKAQRFARHANPATTIRYDDNRADFAGELAALVAGD